MKKTILVADGDKQVLTFAEKYLPLEGFSVLTARTGEAALSTARRCHPDLIMLDAVLRGELDARAFLAAYESECPLPCVLLMAAPTEINRLKGSAMAGWDYLSKPFRPRQLATAIRRALYRAGQPEETPSHLEAAGITLDRASRLVRVAERLVDLTPSEFDLLAVLMSAPGCVMSRSDLLTIVRGPQDDCSTRLIDIHIKNLRAKIEADPHAPRFIQTVYGFGYRFCRDAAVKVPA